MSQRHRGIGSVQHNYSAQYTEVRTMPIGRKGTIGLSRKNQSVSKNIYLPNTKSSVNVWNARHNHEENLRKLVGRQDVTAEMSALISKMNDLGDHQTLSASDAATWEALYSIFQEAEQSFQFLDREARKEAVVGRLQNFQRDTYEAFGILLTANMLVPEDSEGPLENIVVETKPPGCLTFANWLKGSHPTGAVAERGHRIEYAEMVFGASRVATEQRRDDSGQSKYKEANDENEGKDDESTSQSKSPAPKLEDEDEYKDRDRRANRGSESNNKGYTSKDRRLPNNIKVVDFKDGIRIFSGLDRLCSTAPGVNADQRIMYDELLYDRLKATGHTTRRFRWKRWNNEPDSYLRSEHFPRLRGSRLILGPSHSTNQEELACWLRFFIDHQNNQTDGAAWQNGMVFKDSTLVTTK
ncbi:hypothetical protein PIIN_09415 [Serendipita indica DSM 11827]|uniref:Uncharacterized protein n=1 Tax=Serendipita indica (strain DSM 11827) TaxID=1109443 RepID=G4TVT9_SERID|nr:hypothetical protein PIIN_09415 [Serendipita indica DSM 11827]